jgi:hypothetical protein
MDREIFTLEYMLAVPAWDHPMTYVTLLSSVLSVSALGWMWLKRRHWFLQPSLLIMSVVVVRIQLPSLFFTTWAVEYLPRPWDFAAMTQFFPLLYLIAAIPLSNAKDSMLRELATRMKAQLLSAEVWPKPLLLFCFAMSVLTIALHCIYLPFRESGLYAVFADPLGIDTARAATWQVIDNRLVGYMLGWGYYVFGVLLVFGASITLFTQLNRIFQSPFLLLCLGVGFVTLTYTANRGGFALFTLMLLGGFLCARRRMPTKKSILVVLIATLAMPAYVTLMREGRSWNIQQNLEYINNIFLHRIMEVPTQMGMLYIYDAQVVGYSGAGGFRLFAQMTGQVWEPMQEKIGNEYLYAGQYCNAMAAFEYYKIMGLFGLVFSVVFILCLDLFLFLLRIPGMAVLPFCVFFALKGIQCSETTFTVLLLSGGMIFVPVIAFFSRFPPTENRLGPANQRVQAPPRRQEHS